MAFEVRPAQLRDVPAIIELAMASVAVDALPVKPSAEAMRETAQALISNRSQFVWVTEEAGQVVACVGAMCSRSFWFQGWQASMLLFWSRSPGAAVPLLRRFAAWVKERPVIKLAIVECEPGVDPRTLRFLQRLGFQRQSTNVVYVK